ncbi:MAG: metal ABC transporter permease [Spirochaetales bacterium]|nr:metal ABC transporter permease [Spirochaetales bacterium]
MNWIYGLMDTLLPFEFLSHDFTKNAFLAILLVAPTFGILGTMVVSNRMAFFSDSLGHSIFAGIAIGILLGFKDPLLALVGFSITFAILISVLKNKTGGATTTTISIVTSLVVALGISFLSSGIGGGFSRYSSYMIGDILSITSSDLLSLLAVLVIVMVFWWFLYNRLLLLSIHTHLALSRGVRAYLLELSFMALIAVVVAISIQWIGLFIINSFLVIPASAARNLSRNVRQYHLFSILITFTAGISGLVLSFYWNASTGAVIVLITGVFYFLSLLVKNRRS